MNVFMPCESISKSVQALDDARLRKQIVECKVLLEGAIAYQKGEKPNGYFKHPVTQHYKDYPDLLCLYGYECCREYASRFLDLHEYYNFFMNNVRKNAIVFASASVLFASASVLYAEGRKDTPECIRTTDPDKVYDLFKQKLIKKWKADVEKGRPPKWTNRGCPEWAKGDLIYNAD